MTAGAHGQGDGPAAQILDRLQHLYPDARCALQFADPWQLLVATILSAQCTDVRVNQVTPQLFARFPDAAALAAADPGDIEALVRSTGFYRNKARHLLGCAVRIVTDHGGRVPASMTALTGLPGVGRKTANVILGNAFGIPGMVVDTHIGRLARRFGWTSAHDPVRVERDLCRLLPAARWTLASHLLIAHGRACCRAQTAWCSRCCLADLCPRIGVTRQR
ncbi:MAG: endonuclease III [Desulfuromonadales bacterium]|nr:endonuclease III [Desulfuromonadales bacterium]